MKFRSNIDIPLVPAFSVKLGQASYGNKCYKIKSSPKWFEPSLNSKWLVWVEGEEDNYAVENRFSIIKRSGPLKIFMNGQEIGELFKESLRNEHGTFSICVRNTFLKFIYEDNQGYQIKDKDNKSILKIPPLKSIMIPKWEDVEAELDIIFFEPIMIGIGVIYRFVLENMLEMNSG